ncbi:hypothetical protein [Desulfogranum japonicum]|uniref:hypothetical protein n=1 Tax=Desulfogranum japonicum TaxID=231447 RepID=UPI000405251B|nr:hypothetical protein [Desulfogranum japonicum]
MKKIGIVLLLAVALAAGIFVYMSRKAGDILDFATYLPENTLATVSITNLNELTDSFGSSALGKFLAKENINAILDELQVEPAVRDQYDGTHDSVVNLLTNPAFRAVFGRDATLAILPPDMAAMKDSPDKELQRSTIIFARSMASSALDGLAKLMSNSVTAETVDGRAMTRITMEDGQHIYGLTDKDMVLLSYDPSSLIRCMSFHEGEDTLAGSTVFDQAREYWDTVPEEQVYGRLFVHGDSLRNTVAATGQKDVELFLQYTKGITSIVSVAFQQADLLRVDSQAFFEPDQLHQVMKDAIAGQAEKNTTLSLVGDTCLAYYWSSSLNPEVTRRYLQNADEKGMLDMRTLFAEQLGLSIDEVLDAFGPQYGFVVNEIVKGGFFPIPKVLLFAEVRDHDAAVKVVDRVREAMNQTGYAREQQWPHGENTIYYWSVLPGETTQIALVMADNMVYMANGSSTLTTLLDRQGEDTGLKMQLAQAMGKTMQTQVETARFGTYLVYPRRMAGEMRGIMQWLVDMVAVSKGTSLSRISGEFIRLMQSVEVMTGTTTLADDHATWSWTLKSAKMNEQQ